jgi:serine/threonine protein kinase
VDGRLGLPKGTLRDGSYRVKRVIASGGFGITYEAEDVKLGTTVAIKEYFPGEFGRRDDTLSVGPTSDNQKVTFEGARTSFLRDAKVRALLNAIRSRR